MRVAIISIFLINSFAWGAGGFKHHASIFAGATTGAGHTDFTAGIDYEYRMSRHFGIGVLADMAFSSPVHTILAASFFIHHESHLKLFFAPGISLKNGKSHSNFRTGFAYDIPVGEKTTLSPLFAGDFAAKTKPHWVYGLAFGLGF